MFQRRNQGRRFDIEGKRSAVTKKPLVSHSVNKLCQAGANPNTSWWSESKSQRQERPCGLLLVTYRSEWVSSEEKLVTSRISVVSRANKPHKARGGTHVTRTYSCACGTSIVRKDLLNTT